MKTLENILSKIGKVSPALKDFEQYQPADEEEDKLLKRIREMLPYYPDFAALKHHEIDQLLDLANYHLEHGLNLKVPDGQEKTALNDTADVSNSALGLIPRPNITPIHGTHVAGILGAVRNNGKGMDGVADHVEIMTIKVLTNIRELREEDLARGIRFAADHGAKVINLSFGKAYTWNEKAVNEAVKYAMLKDVLIVHAAGNEGIDLDKTNIYPMPVYADVGRARAWIEVGASGWKDDSTLKADFSNYGKNRVDVFAPGVEIYSCMPHSKYQSFSGTSMAAPVVSGLAALIREYYPHLKAWQVREIILASVVKPAHEVMVYAGGKSLKKVPFSEICVAGGIVNAYNALKLAAQYK